MSNISCSEINQLCYELHWKYLEEDENENKILLKKKFDSHIRKYLCNVPHNQKFLLDETYEVLKKSISQMEDSKTANPAFGFEAINLYACNLFIRPWRKEYRVLRMYSGYYQHEVKPHLRDAILLFLAIGYKQAPNETLIFDGEICPDKVRNVSRDAMSAYIECKIIKEIYCELLALKFPITYADIYYFREKGIGDGKGIIEAIFSTRNKNYNRIQENFYGCTQPPPQQLQQQQTQHGGYIHHCNQQIQQQPISIPVSQQPPQHQLCNLHPQQQQLPPNTEYMSLLPYSTYQMAPPPTILQQQQQQMQQQQKPLEYYGYNNDYFFNQPHDCSRQQTHQIPTIINDQQIHQYDYIDGEINSYNNYDTTIYNNKPGNRYPLHYSSALQFNLDNPILCNGGGGGHYRSIPSYQQQQQLQQQQNYNSHYGCNNIPKTVTDFNIYDNHNHPPPPQHLMYKTTGADMMTVDKHGSNLIDLDEDENYFQPQKYYKTNEQTGKLRDMSRYENLINKENIKIRNNETRIHDDDDDDDDDDHDDARNNYYEQRRLPNVSQIQHTMSNDIDQNYQTSRTTINRKTNGNVNAKILAGDYDTEKSSSRNSDFDSYEETEPHYNNKITSTNNKLLNKNHDGIGSAHKWTKIMNETEKKNMGHTDDNIDLLKGLNLDTPSSTWSDKKNKHNRIEIIKNKKLDNEKIIESKNNIKSTSSTTNNIQITPPNDNNKKQILNLNKSDSIKSINKTNEQSTHSIIKPAIPIRSSTTKLTTSKSRKLRVDERIKCKSNDGEQQQLIVLKHQWNCMHCTYINSEDTRICEMCCKSKDFTESKTQKCA